MLTILASILGFAGPFIPELLKLFRQKADNAHELAVLELQAKAANAQHMYRMEEVNAQADIAEMQTLRQPQQSFGVQLLDAAANWPRGWIMPVFYLFAALDFLAGMVRPSVTYAIVGFYLAYKWALFELAKVRMGGWAEAATTVWGENDIAVLMLCLSYYFGARTAKAAFGGSASTGKPGGG